MLLLYTTIISLILVFFIVYLIFHYLYSYWKRRHIAFVKPWPAFGNLLDLFLLRVSFGELFKQLYEHPDIKHLEYGGIYLLHQPALLIREPDLIRKVLIKNFDKFVNRFEAADCRCDHFGYLTLPLSKFYIWHTCRRKISEVFTTGRIKNRMYPLMIKIAKELESFVLRLYVDKFEKNAAIEIEIKEMCSLFTSDLTSILHYGVDMKGLQNGNSSLRQQTKELFKINFRKVYNFLLIFFLPHLATILRAKVFSQTYTNFMRQFTLDCIRRRQDLNYKDSAIQGDLLDVLQHFQKEQFTARVHTYTQNSDFIPSQVGIFLLAGFETSSSVMGLILYELTKYPSIQKQLRSELKMAFENSKFLSYEKLQSLSYLHQVVCEGLRMYPAAAFINRECTAGGESAKGYYLKSDLFVPKGMPLYVSILGLHRDPKHWPDPNIFRPERFAANNFPHIKPMTYIPFGAGPHGCIGSRLGLLQVKLGLAHILKICRVHRCARTQNEINFDATSFMLQAKGGIYLKFIKDKYC